MRYMPTGISSDASQNFMFPLSGCLAEGRCGVKQRADRPQSIVAGRLRQKITKLAVIAVCPARLSADPRTREAVAFSARNVFGTKANFTIISESWKFRLPMGTNHVHCVNCIRRRRHEIRRASMSE